MTPFEKAKELVDKYYQLFPLQKDVISIYGTLTWEYNNWEQAKKSALIAVDEILNIACDESDYDISVTKTYWQEVKQEIENL
jgi:hypothetical protein